MKDSPNARLESGTHLTTVLDRVRATVVVRRRVYEVPREIAGARSPLAATSESGQGHHEHDEEEHDEDEDDNGPPSSVNVARALASLRAHELKRLEAILGDQEDDEPPAPADPGALAPPGPPVPTLKLGPKVAIPELARRMGVVPQDIVTALVTRGFFAVNGKTVLMRDTAQHAAAAFGWAVEPADEPADEPRPGRIQPPAARDQAPAAAVAARTGASRKRRVPAVTTKGVRAKRPKPTTRPSTKKKKRKP